MIDHALGATPTNHRILALEEVEKDHVETKLVP